MDLDYLLDTEKLCDVTFSFGEEPNTVILKAHKYILSAASPVFATMFSSTLASKDECIKITDIDHAIFKLLLLYIYRKSVELNNIDEAFKLYYAAKKYMLTNLMQTCTIYMMTNMQTDIALEVYEFAMFYDELTLSEAAIQHSAMNAKEVLKEDSFKQISPATVLTLFKRDDLTIDTETDLIDAIARYNNPLHKIDFLKQVRFKCLTPRQFIECETIHLVFTLEEQYAILANLTSPKCVIPVPIFFNVNLEPRKIIQPCGKTEHVIQRSFTTNGYNYFSNFATSLKLNINYHYDVEIIAIYVATQVFDELNTKFKNAKFIPEQPVNNMYDEHLYIAVTDEYDNEIASVDFRSSIRFDQTTRINFDTPVVINPGLCYKITIDFKKSGFYPLAVGNYDCTLENCITKFAYASNNEKDVDGFIRTIVLCLGKLS